MTCGSCMYWRHWHPKDCECCQGKRTYGRHKECDDEGVTWYIMIGHCDRFDGPMLESDERCADWNAADGLKQWRLV